MCIHVCHDFCSVPPHPSFRIKVFFSWGIQWFLRDWNQLFFKTWHNSNKAPKMFSVYTRQEELHNWTKCRIPQFESNQQTKNRFELSGQHCSSPRNGATDDGAVAVEGEVKHSGPLHQRSCSDRKTFHPWQKKKKKKKKKNIRAQVVRVWRAINPFGTNSVHCGVKINPLLRLHVTFPCVAVLYRTGKLILSRNCALSMVSRCNAAKIGIRHAQVQIFFTSNKTFVCVCVCFPSVSLQVHPPHLKNCEKQGRLSASRPGDSSVWAVVGVCPLFRQRRWRQCGS